VSKWLSDPSLSGGGVFDLLIHDVDYCVHLFGAPAAVSAMRIRRHAARNRLHRGAIPLSRSWNVVVTGGWHHPKAYPFSMEFT